MNKVLYDFAKYSLIGIITIITIAAFSFIVAIGYQYVSIHYPELGEPIYKGAMIVIFGVVLPASLIVAVIGD